MRILLGIMLFVAAQGTGLTATSTGVELRPASEVIDLLKSNYVDHDKLDGKLLNDATVAGILQALGPGAQIITPDAPASNGTDTVAAPPPAPLARAEIIEPDIGYLRIIDLSDATPAAVDMELKKFSTANVSGMLLDLRFAGGTNFAAAAVVACRFVGDDRNLFAIKGAAAEPKVFSTGACTATLGAAAALREAPLLVLINSETRGAAEALAGALRAHNRAILAGSKTAGAPVATRDLPLGDGRVLRLATAKVLLPADETKSVFTGEVFPAGLTPDIAIKIDAKIEREAVLNAAADVTLTASLQPKELKRRFGEADLVRAFRGEPLDLKLSSSQTNVTLTPKLFGNETNTTVTPKMLESPVMATNSPDPTTVAEPVTSKAGGNGDAGSEKSKDDEPEMEPVRDVVLQRAVDVLKGIRVLLSRL